LEACGLSGARREPISADDTQALENLAGYVVRNPLSLHRLVYLDGQQAVIYKELTDNPTLGRNFGNDGPAGMVGENGGSHPGSGETSHALLQHHLL
jgi:hypothetical protein